MSEWRPPVRPADILDALVLHLTRIECRLDIISTRLGLMERDLAEALQRLRIAEGNDEP
jgi:hypothetical protein